MSNRGQNIDTVVTLKEVFDEQFKDIDFDKRLIDAVYRYQVWFLNRNEEHLAFFGSNLIGVHVIRFRVADMTKFYTEVAKIDFGVLERAVSKIAETSLVFNNKISNDVMNLTLVYLMHRIVNSPKLTEKQRERGIYDTALIFFYRCIAIRQSEYFITPADPKIAQAAYAELSKKFLIKQLGSWRAVMEYRAHDLCDPKGLHLQVIKLFTDDEKIFYVINDSENRIRDLYKNYCSVFYSTKESGNRITSVSSTIIDAEGAEKVREKIKSTEQYVNYIRQVVVDKQSFVRPDLVSAIVDINTNSSHRMVSNSAGWLSDKYNDPKWHAKIDDFLRLVVVHSFHLLAEVRHTEMRDYPALLMVLKNMYLSTRSSDQDLKKIRKLGDELIRAANGYVNNSLAMATRTSLILYITLRAIIITPH